MSLDISRKMEAVGTQILTASHNELYLNMRFLDIPLSSLAFVMNTQTFAVGTDGFCLYYDPQYLVDMYRIDRIRINRIYLHNVFHCIFRHILKQGRREKRLWDLSCDIAAEHTIDGLYRPEHPFSEKCFSAELLRTAGKGLEGADGGENLPSSGAVAVRGI